MRKHARRWNNNSNNGVRPRKLSATISYRNDNDAVIYTFLCDVQMLVNMHAVDKVQMFRIYRMNNASRLSGNDEESNERREPWAVTEHIVFDFPPNKNDIVPGMPVG